MSDHKAALERFVRRLLLRSELCREEQQALLDLPGRVLEFDARRDIVAPGQTLSHATLVADGLAARFDQMSNGQRQLNAFHIPGDMCDLFSVVAPTAGWGITALARTTIVAVPHDNLRGLFIRFPAIGLAFWRDGTADASILAKLVGNLGRQSARSRLAHAICELGIRFECVGLGTRTSFVFSATQEQLADALGLTPVHVNRTLQVLRGEGVLATRGRTIEVLDLDRLMSIAEFDPSYLLLRKLELPHGRTEPAGQASPDRAAIE